MASKSDWEATFAAAQQAPGFRAWLEIMDFQVEEFLTFDLPPEMPEDPFTAEGLEVAETVLLGTFAQSSDLVRDEASKTLFDRYARFIGECFVRKLSGRWVDVPPQGKAKGYVGVLLPTSDLPIMPFQLVTIALARGRGKEWASVFTYAEEDAREGAFRSVLPH